MSNKPRSPAQQAAIAKAQAARMANRAARQRQMDLDRAQRGGEEEEADEDEDRSPDLSMPHSPALDRARVQDERQFTGEAHHFSDPADPTEISPEEAIQKGALDSESALSNEMLDQTFRKKAMGEKVAWNARGPVLYNSCTELWLPRAGDRAKVYLYQTKPRAAELDVVNLQDIPEYSDMIRYLKQRFWHGDDAEFKWMIVTDGRRIRGRDLVAFAADPMVSAAWRQRALGDGVFGQIPGYPESAAASVLPQPGLAPTRADFESARRIHNIPYIQHQQQIPPHPPGPPGTAGIPPHLQRRLPPPSWNMPRGGNGGHPPGAPMPQHDPGYPYGASMPQYDPGYSLGVPAPAPAPAPVQPAPAPESAPVQPAPAQSPVQTPKSATREDSDEEAEDPQMVWMRAQLERMNDRMEQLMSKLQPSDPMYSYGASYPMPIQQQVAPTDNKLIQEVSRDMALVQGQVHGMQQLMREFMRHMNASKQQLDSLVSVQQTTAAPVMPSGYSMPAQLPQPQPISAAPPASALSSLQQQMGELEQSYRSFVKLANTFGLRPPQSPVQGTPSASQSVHLGPAASNGSGSLLDGTTMDLPEQATQPHHPDNNPPIRIQEAGPWRFAFGPEGKMLGPLEQAMFNADNIQELGKGFLQRVEAAKNNVERQKTDALENELINMRRAMNQMQNHSQSEQQSMLGYIAHLEGLLQASGKPPMQPAPMPPAPMQPAPMPPAPMQPAPMPPAPIQPAPMPPAPIQPAPMPPVQPAPMPPVQPAPMPPVQPAPMPPVQPAPMQPSHDPEVLVSADMREAEDVGSSLL